MRELGLSQSTVCHYVRHYEAVFLYCIENGIDFSCQDATDFCKIKYGAELQKSTAKDARKAAYTVARYFENGEFSWEPVAFTTSNPASKAYKELMAEFQKELSKSRVNPPYRLTSKSLA